ncbi:MAG: hypothetical protein GTO63_04345, partial [Anaerolineae bacterium]|nr:hypothetical protein [Anaerolineae bacterium]NIN94241.1 hypothetical protein [Anaerolineae bacterium]NIQ77309.1 hypothetical protein [Anaerolineae bacterium]
GEAWDTGVELLYLRARYYQPETGRFITKDPWAGDLWRPRTLDAYLYVGNNPVNLVDPRGLNGEQPPHEPPIVGRSEWGALQPGEHTMYVNGCRLVSGLEEGFFDPNVRLGGYARYSQLYPYGYPETLLRDVLDTIVIHHEGNLQRYDVRIVQIRHMFGEGYSDIGYHFVVGRDGTIYEGRDIGARGAHVILMNKRKIGLLLLGDYEPGLDLGGGRRFPLDFDDERPSWDQIMSTVHLIRWLDYLYGIDRVVGHGELPDQNTSCPGERMKPYMQTFRAAAKER